MTSQPWATPSKRKFNYSEGEEEENTRPKVFCVYLLIYSC